MRRGKPSITNFVLVAALIAFAAEAILRLLFSEYGAEAVYDEYGWLPKSLVGGPPLLWACSYFGVHERLRQRGHIR